LQCRSQKIVEASHQKLYNMQVGSSSMADNLISCSFSNASSIDDVPQSELNRIDYSIASSQLYL
jgi:hypothetical protein